MERIKRKLLERYEWLAGKVVADGWNEATVLPQLHVLIWGNKRGVFKREENDRFRRLVGLIRVPTSVVNTRPLSR